MKDFVGIELQTLDTTGTLWPERQKFLHEHGINVALEELNTQKKFGMNWKMTLKTILVQMHHKSETFEHFNKHLVLIVQKPLFDRMLNNFNFDGISDVRLWDPIHIHSYEFQTQGRKLKLSLNRRISTDSNGIANCLGLKAERKIELQKILSVLEKKLTDTNSLNIGVI